jgi:hypothetical protein
MLKNLIVFSSSRWLLKLQQGIKYQRSIVSPHVPEGIFVLKALTAVLYYTVYNDIFHCFNYKTIITSIILVVTNDGNVAVRTNDSPYGIFWLVIWIYSWNE